MPCAELAGDTWSQVAWCIGRRATEAKATGVRPIGRAQNFSTPDHVGDRYLRTASWPLGQVERLHGFGRIMQGMSV